MDYKQHKGNLRGQIKNQVERKLYNKRIRTEAIDVDTSERQLTIPAVTHRFSVGDKVNYCNGLIFEIASINEKAEVCYDKNGMWYALVNCKPA